MTLRPVPLSVTGWTRRMRRHPLMGCLARTIARREGWGSDAWQWTDQQRGLAWAEIQARLDPEAFTIPRATINGDLDATLPGVRPPGRAG